MELVAFALTSLLSVTLALAGARVMLGAVFFFMRRRDIRPVRDVEQVPQVEPGTTPRLAA